MSADGLRVHHSAIVVADLDRSLRFWRDGIGMRQLMDHEFEGDWPELFGAPSRRLRSVFLGAPDQPEAGIVELVVFEDAASPRPAAAGGAAPAATPTSGFFLLSIYTDVPAALARLAEQGVHPEGRIQAAGLAGPVDMATVRDPDGVLVELVGV